MVLFISKCINNVSQAPHKAWNNRSAAFKNVHQHWPKHNTNQVKEGAKGVILTLAVVMLWAAWLQIIVGCTIIVVAVLTGLSLVPFCGSIVRSFSHGFMIQFRRKIIGHTIILNTFTFMLRNETENSEQSYGKSTTSSKSACTKLMLKCWMFSMRYIKAVGESAAFVNNPSSDLYREEVVLWQEVFGRTLSRARDTDGKVKDFVSKMMWVLRMGTNLSNLVKPNQAFTKFLHSFSAHVHGNLTTDSFNEHARLILYATQNDPPELQECFIWVLNDGDNTPLVIELYELIKTFTTNAAKNRIQSANHLYLRNSPKHEGYTHWGEINGGVEPCWLSLSLTAETAL